MLNVAQLSGVAAQLSECCWPSSRWEPPPRPRPNFRARRFHTSLDPLFCHVLLQRPDISPFLITVFTFDHLPLSGIISSLIDWHSYHFHALHSSSFLSCLLLCFYIYKLLITLFTFDSFPLGGNVSFLKHDPISFPGAASTHCDHFTTQSLHCLQLPLLLPAHSIGELFNQASINWQSAKKYNSRQSEAQEKNCNEITQFVPICLK